MSDQRFIYGALEQLVDGHNRWNPQLRQMYDSGVLRGVPITRSPNGKLFLIKCPDKARSCVDDMCARLHLDVQCTDAQGARALMQSSEWGV